MSTDLFTIFPKLLRRKATVVSVDKDVCTETDAAELAWENMRGKLLRIGNGKRVRDLHIASVSSAEVKVLKIKQKWKQPKYAAKLTYV